MDQRDTKLDRIKGLMIALVVLGHSIEAIPQGWSWHNGGPWSFVYSCIYLFHVPAFVFLSGFFSFSRKGVLQGALELLLLYVLAGQIWVAYSFPMVWAGGPHPEFRGIPMITPGWGLWYLLSLLSWRIATPMLARVKHPVPAVIFLLLYATLVGVSNMDAALALGRTIAYFPFFAAGFWCRQRDWSYARPGFTRYDAVAVVVGGVLGGVVLDQCYRHSIKLLQCNFSYESLGVSWQEGALLRLGHCVVAFVIIRLFFLFMPSRPAFLATLGRRSLSIYIGHFYLVRPLRYSLGVEAWRQNVWWLAPAVVVFSCTFFSLVPVADHLLWVSRWLCVRLFKLADGGPPAGVTPAGPASGG